MHKVPRTNGRIPSTRTSGKKFLKNSMNLASRLEEKSHAWNESSEDSAKREGDILKLAELAAQDEKQEDEERLSSNSSSDNCAKTERRR